MPLSTGYTPVFHLSFCPDPSSSWFSETASVRALGSSTVHCARKNRKTFPWNSRPKTASGCRKRLQPDGHERISCTRHFKAFGIYTATRSLSKCGLRAVSVAHGNPALGLSSRQVRPRTPISSRYCAIGPITNHCYTPLLCACLHLHCLHLSTPAWHSTQLERNSTQRTC
jgi:hypothetical protein